MNDDINYDYYIQLMQHGARPLPTPTLYQGTNNPLLPNTIPVKQTGLAGVNPLQQQMENPQIPAYAQTMLKAQKTAAGNPQPATTAGSGISGEAILGAVPGVIGGISGMIAPLKTLAGTKDTTMYEDTIGAVDDISRVNYNNYDQVQRDWTYLNTSLPKVTAEDLYTTDTKGTVAGIGSAALSGATAGFSVGGGWGALVGGLLGAAGGGIATAIGRNKAQLKAQELNEDRLNAISDAQTRVRANSDNLSETFRRRGIANVGAEGGQMERKQQSLQEFADRVFKAQKNNDKTHSAGIVRQHCNGGTMVRIKMK